MKTWPTEKRALKWQRTINKRVTRLNELTITKSEITEKLGITVSRLDGWLKGNGRPGYMEALGVATLMSEMMVFANQVPKGQKEEKARRLKEWPGRTVKNIAETDGIKDSTVREFASRNKIKIQLLK